MELAAFDLVLTPISVGLTTAVTVYSAGFGVTLESHFARLPKPSCLLGTRIWPCFSIVYSGPSKG